MKVYVDSDVVISSLLSKKGAGYFLLHKQRDEKKLQLYISNWSKKEIEKVSRRLEIPSKPSEAFRAFELIRLGSDVKKLKKEFGQYTNDPNDSHIIAGLAKSKADFLVTYNFRDYKVEKIKRELNAIVTTPGKLLQYLRTIN